MISQSTIDKIDALDIYEVISRFYQTRWKKSGARHVALSPFNNEKTPSFSVNPKLGIWKCFSSDLGGKGAISFVKKYMGYSFREATEAISEAFSIEVVYEDRSEDYVDYRRIFEAYMPIFKKALLRQPSLVRSLQAGGMSTSAILSFGIGYCPKDIGPAEGITHDEFKKAEIYKFRGRIVFPIRNRTGRVVALTGRAVEATQEGKYVNSSDRVWKKESHLYGADMCAFQGGKAILVEGQKDVIALHTYLLKSAVGKSTSVITHRQAKILSRNVSQVILMPDHDKAGLKSVWKDAGRLMANGIYVSICLPPKGMDPADWIQKEVSLSSLPVRELHEYAAEIYHSIPLKHRPAFVGALISKVYEVANPILGTGFFEALGEKVGLSKSQLLHGWTPQRSRSTTPLPNAGNTKIQSSDIIFQVLAFAAQAEGFAGELAEELLAPFPHPIAQKVWDHIIDGGELDDESENLYASVGSCSIDESFFDMVMLQGIKLIHSARIQQIRDGISSSDRMEEDLKEIEQLSIATR